MFKVIKVHFINHIVLTAHEQAKTATGWVFIRYGAAVPLRGADKNLMLPPGRRLDQHYQELTPGRASVQSK